MPGSASDPSRANARHRADNSTLHLLAVWVLVGASLVRLGTALYEAGLLSGPLSRLGTGWLLGTAVVSAAWVVGFRPSVLASGAYFLLESIGYLLLLVAVARPLGGSVVHEPWLEVGLRCLSITIAGALVFTAVGRRLRQWSRAVLNVPPNEHAPK